MAAAIIQRGDRYLITQRLKASHLGHLWEFPGGKIELGESPEQCAIRECLEEIGVQIEPVRRIQEIAHVYPEVRVHLYFILCKLLEGEPRPIECADCRWIKRNEFKNFDFPAADHKIIELLSDEEPL